MRWGAWQAHDRRERLRLFLSKLDETALQALTAKTSIEDEVACSASPHSAPPSSRALPCPVQVVKPFLIACSAGSACSAGPAL